jgi:hypothetical protein
MKLKKTQMESSERSKVETQVQDKDKEKKPKRNLRDFAYKVRK